MLYLSAPATVAGVELQAGRYFLLTVPREDEWTILLNRSDAATPEEIVNDLVEVGRGLVDIEHLDDHVEMFTIRGRESKRGADLILEWEHLRVRIPIELLE